MGRGAQGAEVGGSQPDWHANCTVAANAITQQQGNDAQLARPTPGGGGAGVFTLTLGNSGVDPTQSHVSVVYNGPAGLTCQVVRTSATVVTLNFTAGSNGAATDPTYISVDVWRRNAH